MSDHAREVRNALTDPRRLCEQLGLLAGRGSFVSQGQRGVTVRCCFHDEKTPSMSVTRGPDGTVRLRCFGCDAGGDALALIAAVRGLSLRRDFRAVLVEAAHLGGLLALAADLEAGRERNRPAYVPPPPPPEPERDYPDQGELAALLAACVPVAADPEVSAMVAGRGLDPELVAVDGLALALPAGTRCPRWAAYHGVPWTRTGHRCLLPVVGPSGAILSVRAWRVTDGDSPKRLPPGGCRATGLVMADPLALAWLRGTARPERVLVVEGEPDFLAACGWRLPLPYCRIGIWSGAWSPEFSRRCHARLKVYVWTDPDQAGDRYAEQIAKSLVPRGCQVHRWTPEAA